MLEIFQYSIITLYFLTAFILLVYGLNCYVMIYLFKNGRQQAEQHRQAIISSFEKEGMSESLPKVTTQIPVYNEYNVAERIIRSACSMEYPAEKHEIQVLDDSVDETVKLVDEVVRELSEKGHNVRVIRRDNRTGYKAGALAHGLTVAEGDFIAIFDADFVPPEDYLIRSIPFFLEQSDIGLVQARWGHLNRNASMLTRAQSIGIDGHFMVEQSARNWSGLYMNFNGTAGVWRRQAIDAGGGWQWDTLTEDMDLSYRVQFAGWKTMYLPDLVVPAEIPENICAFKSQQFRWAKGSIETAIKLFPDLIKAPVPLFQKIEAFFHLTHYMVHPMMILLAVLAYPVMTLIENGPGPLLFSILAMFLIVAMSAPSTLYVVSQKAGYSDWRTRILWLPFLIIAGTGIAVSNTRAVAEALFGIKSGFIRTPKKGDVEQKSYSVPLPVAAIVELALGCYCAFSLSAYLTEGKYFVGPFLAVYASGFLFTGILTLIHSYGGSR